MLQGSVQVNAAGSVERNSGEKRRYSMLNRRSTPSTVPLRKKKELPSIESISDGSHLDPLHEIALAAPVDEEGCNKFFCCNSKCNEQWDTEALSRTRTTLVRYGAGTQTARRVVVRECIASETRQLHIKDGMQALAVCWRFYRALMGVSFNLIRAAGGLGSVHM